ncbi:hypothetical protein Q5P01_023107 [Channa striata]|uniref:Uncharacterized protein n=1 Tax=Channa striata TaxID=64152 RepID=A0AA88J9P2_CHASR|nr:hypothetical protein Q5P01_023107 [Channa striata]
MLFIFSSRLRRFRFLTPDAPFVAGRGAPPDAVGLLQWTGGVHKSDVISRSVFSHDAFGKQVSSIRSSFCSVSPW